MNFNELIDNELKRAKEKHNHVFSSHHEAYAIILEELDEYWDEVRKGNKNRDKKNMLLELVQISAMCRKAAEDLNLIKP